MIGTENGSSKSLLFRQKTLDALSPSFCGAKWFEGTLWLNSGLTASCHHTPAHNISREDIKKDPSALHNTAHKKAMRRLMQKGIRPEECEYCWKIEDMATDAISDRVLKSERVPVKNLKTAMDTPWSESVLPQYLEIAFDRICQFACMYCSPSFSTTWERDISLGGKYEHLSTDFEEHYISAHESVKLEDKGAEYVAAFWRWWPELATSLKTLRITGGEPLLSPHFWSLIGRQDVRDHKIRLAVNSNLGLDTEKIKDFLKALEGCEPVEIYTSGEGFGAVGEYIRDGKVWSVWTKNIDTVLQSPRIKNVCVSFSINALSVMSLIPMLNYVMELRARFGADRVKFFWNIVRFPRFQSMSVLPPSIRTRVADDIVRWLVDHGALIADFERHSIERFLQYLALEDGPTAQVENVDKLQADLKNFLVQYDRRRGKNYSKVLSTPLVEWLDSIKTSKDLL